MPPSVHEQDVAQIEETNKIKELFRLIVCVGGPDVPGSEKKRK